MMMMRYCYCLILLFSCLAVSEAFVVAPQSSCATVTALYSKKDNEDEVVQQKAFPVGAFVEFQEKNRIHVGKIETVEHTASGVARYQVIDSEQHKYDVADKQVLYSMPCPNTPAQAKKLFEEFCRAQDAPLATLQEQLDISPELVQMAWEECACTADDGDDETTTSDHIMTADDLIQLVHAHAASSIERYLAWKLLKSDMAHVFFKEIKDRGRVVSFKAKPEKAVENAKQVFCKTHEDNEICFV